MKNLHWMIQGSDLLENQTMHWVVDIQVKHCDDETQAISRAKEIVPRKHYHLRSVLECDCAEHSLQHRKSLDISKKTADALIKIMGHENEGKPQQS